MLQAEGYALDRVNRSEGDAVRFTAIHDEYRRAPEVTRRRLYLETMQRILPQVGRKLYVDKDTTGVLPLLSLDGVPDAPRSQHDPLLPEVASEALHDRPRSSPPSPSIVLLAQSLYTVSETEQVILTQFGEPVGDPVVTPGLHFKLPFIQKSNVFEKRFLEWDGSPNQVPTRDKRFIWVDTYARWRITDPLLFFQRLRDERGAQSRLDDILDGETRNAVARHDLIELVRSSNRDPEDVPIESEEETVILEAIERGRREITREILSTAAGADGRSRASSCWTCD